MNEVTKTPLDANQRYTLPEASEYLRISRTKIYQRVADGKLRLLKDGGHSFITGKELIRYCSGEA